MRQKFLFNLYTLHTKKDMSNSSGLVDLAIRVVSSAFDLHGQHLKFSGGNSNDRSYCPKFMWIKSCFSSWSDEVKLHDVLVQVIAWFVVINGVNTTSDISKLLYLISQAARRVKFETILKCHGWYLGQKSHTNHAIICLYYYPQRFCNFHM